MGYTNATSSQRQTNLKRGPAMAVSTVNVFSHNIYHMYV